MVVKDNTVKEEEEYVYDYSSGSSTEDEMDYDDDDEDTTRPFMLNAIFESFVLPHNSNPAMRSKSEYMAQCFQFYEKEVASNREGERMRQELAKKLQISSNTKENIP